MAMVLALGNQGGLSLGKLWPWAAMAVAIVSAVAVVVSLAWPWPTLWSPSFACMAETAYVCQDVDPENYNI